MLALRGRIQPGGRWGGKFQLEERVVTPVTGATAEVRPPHQRSEREEEGEGSRESLRFFHPDWDLVKAQHAFLLEAATCAKRYVTRKGAPSHWFAKLSVLRWYSLAGFGAHFISNSPRTAQAILSVSARGQNAEVIYCEKCQDVWLFPTEIEAPNFVWQLTHQKPHESTVYFPLLRSRSESDPWLSEPQARYTSGKNGHPDQSRCNSQVRARARGQHATAELKLLRDAIRGRQVGAGKRKT